MINDDVVKCPLCGGFTHISNPTLLAALQQPGIGEQVERYVAELLQTTVKELVPAGVAASEASQFETEVHRWNPCMPMWRRSPKE